MHDKEKNHILTILVDNEPGVLARVIGLFSGRGYNIESLTVSEVDAKRHLSRITITTRGAQPVIDQIIALLERLVPVHRVVDLAQHPQFVARDALSGESHLSARQTQRRVRACLVPRGTAD